MNYWKYLIVLLCLGACHTSSPRGDPFPFLGFAVHGFPVTESMLDTIENETQMIPAIVLFYLQWPNDERSQESIQSSLDVIWDRKSVPCMTWEPMVIVNNTEQAIPYQDILNGKHDSYLTKMASEIRAWKKPIIIRFAQEMNLSRYHWGTALEDFGTASPAIYQAMFRYVVTFFRNQQVDNVLWAFCPNAESVPKENWNVAKNFYPGDQYVDILGMDGYNWDIDTDLAVAKGYGWTKPWISFREVFGSMYYQLKKISPDKPLIVFETASVDRSNSEKKIAWLKDALRVSKQWNIQGLIWFQVNKEEKWKFHQKENTLIDSYSPSFQDWLLKNFNDFR